MKNLCHIAVMLVIVFSASSCIERTGKYKSLLSQKDSLETVNQTIEDSYNETLDLINQIEAGFQEIRESEGKMLVDMGTVEDGSMADFKQNVKAEITSIKEILAENKANIKKLQGQLNKSGKKNTTLAQTIERMEMQMKEKAEVIEGLKEELSKKNIEIGELNIKVSDLNTNIADLSDKNAKQEEELISQANLNNTVYFCIAREKELQAAGILTKGRLFSKEVLTKDFDQSAFTREDLRDLHNINLNATKVKVLSNHPAVSYELVADQDKFLTLQIKDSIKFWSISKFLVVQKIK